MKNIYIFSLLVAASSYFVVATPTQATFRERVENRKERTQVRQENRKERCDLLEERIKNKINNFDNTHQFHVRQYALMKEKISKVITQKESEGKDVSKLKADLQTFDEKVALFDQHRKEFINALKNTQQFACGESEGAFKEAFQAVQGKHRQVLADAKDIRNFYQRVLRADLRALRD